MHLIEKHGRYRDNIYYSLAAFDRVAIAHSLLPKKLQWTLLRSCKILEEIIILM